MQEIKTRIDGFEVELHREEEWADCYVNKGNYSGTLAWLLSYGFLESDSQISQLDVSSRTISRIESWALAHGY